MSKRRNYKRQALAVFTGSAAPQKFEKHERRPAVLAHARSEMPTDAARDALKMSASDDPTGEEDEPSYLESLKAAFLVNGGDAENKPTVGAWVGHIISAPWKVLAALLPPASFMGAYPLFVSSIIFIGLITFLVDEIATLFGCYLGVPSAVTAITFVALGTSLPDTFASRTAALHDDYADDSVGNITGSNSVNVTPRRALAIA